MLTRILIVFLNLLVSCTQRHKKLIDYMIFFLFLHDLTLYRAGDN